MIGRFIPFGLGSVRIAFRALLRSPLRSMLTILGITIGIASVVVVTALGIGARTKISTQIQSFGSNLIIVFPQNAQRSGARSAVGTGPRLNEEDGKAILAEASSIEAAAPSIQTRAQVLTGQRNWSTNVNGTTLPYFSIRDWKLTRGERWSALDELAKAKVCVIGETVREKLFGGGDPTGHRIRIGGQIFTVVGLLEKKGDAPFGGDQDDVILMPISTMRARIMHTSPGFVGVFLLSATSPETTNRAVDQVTAILRQRHRIQPSGNADFTIRTQQQFQEMQSTVYGLLTILMIAIASISLIVGGVGIMNIMLVSIAERTREIGTRLAVGARASDIQAQFLIEALVLSLCGGATGAVVGIALISLGETVLEWPMKLSPTALALSIGSSALTGILFGFIPAHNAAKLDPIVALRHE